MPAINMSNLTHKITVQDIYKTTRPEAPEGYEFTGEFRPAQKGDTILSVPEAAAGGFRATDNDYTTSADPRYPVLILRKQKEYTDTEILNYVIKWLEDSVSSYGIYNHPGTPHTRAIIFRALISSTENTGNIKKDLIKEMRLKGV